MLPLVGLWFPAPRSIRYAVIENAVKANDCFSTQIHEKRVSRLPCTHRLVAVVAFENPICCIAFFIECFRALHRLHIHDEHIQERVRAPELWRRATLVHPLPTTMDRGEHEGRGAAWTRALERCYGEQDSVYYIDIAGPNRRGWYTAAVLHQQRQMDGLTFRAPGPTQVEEVSIALAASNQSSKNILTDSRGACHNYTV